MANGKINVAVENIFPLIKKFLYSDHEIFLRELISNATDAISKLKHLSSIGEVKGEIGDPRIEVKIDKDNKKIHIIDQGVGMTADEVNKYINEVAFSGAEEFLEKYKDNAKDSGIIGHFGLGFYSAFMVAEKVEIITQSHQDTPAVHWTCDGFHPNTPSEKQTKKDEEQRSSYILQRILPSSWKRPVSENYSISTINSCPSPSSLEPRKKPCLYPRMPKKMPNPKPKRWTTSSTTPIRPGPKLRPTLKRRITNPFTESCTPCNLKNPCSTST
jgi:hypothetical protein